MLLLAGASPDAVTSAYESAPVLSVSSYLGHLQMVSLLLEFGANLESRNAEGVTALIFAARAGHCDVVAMLLQAGASLTAVDSDDSSALVHAASNGHLRIVEYLLSCDWPPNKSGELGLAEVAQQALVVAAFNNHAEVSLFSISFLQVSVRIPYQSILFQVLEYLLDLGEVDVNQVDTRYGETALTAAAQSGHSALCSLLHARGARLDVGNMIDSLPLLMATANGHWQVGLTLPLRYSSTDLFICAAVLDKCCCFDTRW